MELPQNIYDQINRNRRITIFIIALFILFFCFIGYGFDLFYLGVDPFNLLGDSRFPIPVGTLFALGFGGISSAYSLQSGAKAVLHSSGAQPVPADAPEYKVLRDVTDEMAIAGGLPRPDLYVIPDADPNAFATGKDPDHASIAVTEGLLKSLNREELQGVIAHEMSHIRNYDIRLMTVIAALVGGILLVADGSRRMMGFGGRVAVKSSGRRSRVGGPVVLILLVVWLIAVILAPLVSQLVATAVSRRREYLADASGAELTRNPLALANALEKIESAEEPTASINKGSAHLCIVDPLGRSMNTKEGFVGDLFGTHPPIGKRITYLKAMAYQFAHPSGAHA